MSLAVGGRGAPNRLRTSRPDRGRTRQVSTARKKSSDETLARQVDRVVLRHQKHIPYGLHCGLGPSQDGLNPVRSRSVLSLAHEAGLASKKGRASENQRMVARRRRGEEIAHLSG